MGRLETVFAGLFMALVVGALIAMAVAESNCAEKCRPYKSQGGGSACYCDKTKEDPTP